MSNENRRCVIVGGADINNYENIKSYLDDDDFVIYCDCGLRHFDAIGKYPDLIVGDFDSYLSVDVINDFGDVETIMLPREKDDTDSVYAAKEALSRGFIDFLIIGAVGGRFDHSLGNAAMLLLLHDKGAKATLIDDYSEMTILDSLPQLIDDSWSYFSLMAIFGQAENISIQNAKFPLDSAIISPEYQYGISNEVLPGKIAWVSVGTGNLLLVKVK